MPNYQLSVVKLSQPTPGRLKCSVMTTLGIGPGDQSEITEAPIKTSKGQLTLSFLNRIPTLFFCWPLKDRASYVLVAGYPCMHGEKATAPAQYCPRSLHIYVRMI